MSQKSTDEGIPTTSCSIPGEDPPTTDRVEGKPTEADNDFDSTVNWPKKRRRRENCPESLAETIKQSANSGLISFTFDTPSCATPDSTPKFGSFDVNRCTQIQPKSEVIKTRSEVEEREEDEEEEEKRRSDERREVVAVVGEVIGSVDGVVESGVD